MAKREQFFFIETNIKENLGTKQRSFFNYCVIILIRGAFNYVEFVGKTIHEFKTKCIKMYQQYKIPSVRLSNARYA